MLPSTLYPNIKFILDRNYFQIIIKKMKTIFFQCGHPPSTNPHPTLSAAICFWLTLPPSLGADILYGWPDSVICVSNYQLPLHQEMLVYSLLPSQRLTEYFYRQNKPDSLCIQSYQVKQTRTHRLQIVSSFVSN